jgi:ribonuclease Z
LLGRESDLHVYGPKGIKEVITLQLKLGKSWTDYKLYFHELDSKNSEVIFDDELVKVSTIPLDHRVYTNGFLFQEKQGERKLNIDAALKAGIDKSYFSKLKQGYDVENTKGELIDNRSVTFPPDPPRSYAYCSDTAFYPAIVPKINKATVLYHESTFLESHHHLCETTKHSTAKEAAVIAKKANVETLILGHYSGRYEDLESFRNEAMEVFQSVELAEDGKQFKF